MAIYLRGPSGLIDLNSVAQQLQKNDKKRNFPKEKPNYTIM